MFHVAPTSPHSTHTHTSKHIAHCTCDVVVVIVNRTFKDEHELGAPYVTIFRLYDDNTTTTTTATIVQMVLSGELLDGAFKSKSRNIFENCTNSEMPNLILFMCSSVRGCVCVYVCAANIYEKPFRTI